MTVNPLLQGCPRFQDLLDRAIQAGPITIAVAGADDPDALSGLVELVAAKLATVLLVGSRQGIVDAAQRASVSLDGMEIVAAEFEKGAVAVDLIRSNRAQVLMKGMIDSKEFLRAVLDRERGLRGRDLLSHVAIYDGPNCPRLWLMTDGGLNVAPDLDAKRGILANAIELARAIEIGCPHVAAISAVEKPDPGIPSTIDAMELAAMGRRGDFGPAIIEGPLALDVALRPEIAAKKGLNSQVSGHVDIFLVPNIETGNVLGKSLMYLAGSRMAGVVVGATAPVLMNSRADTPAGRLASTVVASYLARVEQ